MNENEITDAESPFVDFDEGTRVDSRTRHWCHPDDLIAVAIVTISVAVVCALAYGIQW